MKFSKLFRATLPVFCLSSTLLISQATGTIYVSNSDDASIGGYGVSGGAGLGQPFRTGSSPGGYSLNTVNLSMLYWYPGVSNFQVSIFNNIFGKPGGQVAALTGDNNPVLAGVYDYASSGFILNPNTTYWVVATASGQDTPFSAYFWEATHDVTYLGTDGWQILTGNTYATFNPTAHSWATFPSSTYGSLKIAVDATPVPEPGSLVLIGLGLGCLVGRRCGARNLPKTRV